MNHWFNEFYVLAFIITPAVVVAIGWGAAWLHGYSLKKGWEDK
jgi:hypothetical protein